ncbi:MAG TPA: hypothetical protein VF099_14940, partial [Ktedonobacterales bacterium]
MSTRSDVDGQVALAAAALPDKQMLIEAVKLLHPGRVVELRLLNLDGRGQTASGYFDQPGLLAEAALRYHRRAEGVYLTLNPLPASLLARANNQVRERARQTTTDGEVLRRAWLPLDLDPTRPSGISSSEHEHQAALEQARRIREWLASEWGWHAPIFADSGNGAHLLYAIDLPNDAASTDLIKRCLASLASRFGSEAVTLDRSVYNAARIWKLYGSVARKGEPLPERPHRRAVIISAPDPVELVTREQLEQLAALSRQGAGGTSPISAPGRRDAGGTRTTAAVGRGDGSPALGRQDAGATDSEPFVPLAAGRRVLEGQEPVTEDALLAWLEEHGARVRKTKQEPDRTIYELERCPFAEHHAPGKACVILGNEGVAGFKCQTAGCAEYHWRDLLALWGDGPASERRPASGATEPPSPAGEEAGGTSADDTPAAPVEAGEMQAWGAARAWPEPPRDTVYHGLAGEIVNTILPHTEADPLAMLVQLLTAFGASIGPGPHFKVGPTRHQPRLFSVIVGKSAKARKGDSWQGVREVLELSGVAPRIQTSLSSGEGLIWMVRDPIISTKFVPGKAGQQGHYEQVVEDKGEPEKRVLVVSGEMAQIFKVLRREGNTLSAILRDAWDQGNLSIATRAMAARATGAYLSVIGHITVDELRKELNSLDAANGFANRFCWFAVKRSQELADPDALDEDKLASLAARFRQAVEQARQIGRMQRDALAKAKWKEMYRELGKEHSGFAGALISRSEAQVLRLSMLYALLDGS